MSPDSSRPPASGARLDALASLKQRLAEAGASASERVLHPRDDQLWVTREGLSYNLTVKRGQEVLPFTQRGIRSLATLLDVPAPLLSRLADIGRNEDTRLLNVLLFAAGHQEHVRFRFLVRDHAIAATHSATFTYLTNQAVLDALSTEIEDGMLELRRYSLLGPVLRLDLLLRNVPPISLPTSKSADVWYPTVVILNNETGSTSVTIAPALTRAWGGATLVLPDAIAAVRRHRHADKTPATLARQVRTDVAEIVAGAYAEVDSLMHRLRSTLLKKREIRGVIERAKLPFPSVSAQARVIAKATEGRPSLYRIVTSSLSEAKQVDDPERRVRLEARIAEELIAPLLRSNA